MASLTAGTVPRPPVPGPQAQSDPQALLAPSVAPRPAPNLLDAPLPTLLKSQVEMAGGA